MKKIGIIIVLLIAIGLIGYNYVFQEHRNIESEPPSHTLTSKQVAHEFSIDPETAEAKYLNKTIEITGIISEVSPNEIVIDNTVVCLFQTPTEQDLQTKQDIKIKGRFIGYDNLLEQVKLDQCSIIY
ncbi:hypothetical protein IA57_03715 [Mangrovimonas yunxiaonensis]|uniref:tRNA_anti-like n=1 Tax=Mangrovimonas yunxiaonensis TaxID=1197477 RepID=A0A084TMP6_9FLAO|nr:hypothetical protein [Mangrovimonas yunxiaonensis]KFB01982.1 hypothetical protein IA57_03715 [Mangrovimonas yunxiaonensis]GGH45131.1 hypothetical protein GCM10011364_18350 [Mangrovimonas yunxiaonensis]